MWQDRKLAGPRSGKSRKLEWPRRGSEGWLESWESRKMGQSTRRQDQKMVWLCHDQAARTTTRGKILNTYGKTFNMRGLISKSRSSAIATDNLQMVYKYRQPSSSINAYTNPD
jgi:hypothetical protein